MFNTVFDCLILVPVVVGMVVLQKETPSDVRLHLAAVNGDLKVIRKLLDSGKVHVDCRDKVNN